MSKSRNTKLQIIAFGFDKLGLTIGDFALESDEYDIQHVSYRGDESLSNADAVILPSDIFEHKAWYAGAYGRVETLECDTHLLAEREKQLWHVLNNKGWVCVFLRQVSTENGRDNLDLARKLVVGNFARSIGHDPMPHVVSKTDDFREFFKEFGIAQTTLHLRYDRPATRTLATSLDGHKVFAAEVGGRSFFLPLKNLSRPNEELALIVRCAVDSILAYKKRNDLYLPEWVQSISFSTETTLRMKIGDLRKELETLEADVQIWPRYKAVLCASGQSLNEIVVAILKDFFKLNLHSKETYIEDALIFDEKGEHLFVVEIKGINGGVKRDHINQVDSHRERLQIEHTVPGLLIINDFADVPGLKARKLKPIDHNHLNLAVSQNVRILRTSTLVELMIATECLADRGAVFLQQCLEASPLVELPNLEDSPDVPVAS